MEAGAEDLADEGDRWIGHHRAGRPDGGPRPPSRAPALEPGLRRAVHGADLDRCEVSSEAEAKKVLRLIEALEDHDDVQNVYVQLRHPRRGDGGLRGLSRRACAASAGYHHPGTRRTVESNACSSWGSTPGSPGAGTAWSPGGAALAAVAGGVISTAPTVPLPERLRLPGRRAARHWSVSSARDAVVIERVFFQVNARTAMATGQAAGVALVAAAAAGCEVAQYTSNEVKQALVGYGGATKEQVQRMVAAVLACRSRPARPTWPMRWPWRPATWPPSHCAAR